MNEDMWTWLGGSTTVNAKGVYGSKGVEDPNFVPSARGSAVRWYDESRKELWLFGGGTRLQSFFLNAGTLVIPNVLRRTKNA